MSKKFKCPYKACGKEYKYSQSFITHQLIRHNLPFVTIVGLLFGALITFIVLFYGAEISNWWDTLWGTESKLYASIHSVYLLENKDGFVNLNENQTKKQEFLNNLTNRGVIPIWANKEPISFNLNNCGLNANSCLFFAYDNANIVAKKSQLPENLQSSAGMYRHIIFQTPSEEVIAKLSSSCKECLAHLIYGTSQGKKTIDFVNLKVCFDDNYSIKETSESVTTENKNCIRIKYQNVIKDESFLGYVILKDEINPVYYNLWENHVKEVTGIYSSEGIEIDINSSLVPRTISGVVNNCGFY